MTLTQTERLAKLKALRQDYLAAVEDIREAQRREDAAWKRYRAVLSRFPAGPERSAAIKYIHEETP